jgi:pyruvate/2-oxoglutarate dehydrogenase complex dihydrolipoamide dehydrogenase (E3) component
MTPPGKGEGIYNVVVIGAGTAGLVTAAGTAGLGGRVALIERNKMGGDCLNFGCVPSKALISSARLLDRIRHADKWGLQVTDPQFDFAEVFERMRARRQRLAPNDSQERFESLGVDVFRGEATFRSEWEAEVGGVTLRARNFVIATGTRAAIPKIEGIESVPYFTNETIFDELKTKPESMIVLGGGPIGCELGQAFSRLGVKVTIVQRGGRLLPREDPDVSEFIAARLKREGVPVLTNGEAKSVRKIESGIELTLRHGSAEEAKISASVLLICAGRRPSFGSLGLDHAGVRAGERGVEVNEYLQTTRPHIYAAGDIVGPFLFTHMADAQARVVVRNILMPFQVLRQKIDYSVVPWCTYVDPEVATVGLTESATQKKNVACDVIIQKLEEVDRAVVEDQDYGFAKVVVAKGTDKILGVTLVCESAGDLLHEFVVAMKYGIGLGKIAATIHAYPTLSELARKAGDKYNKTRLTPTARKVFSWLYQRDLSRK